MAKATNLYGVEYWLTKLKQSSSETICSFLCLHSCVAERSAWESNGQVSSNSETAFNSALYPTVSGRWEHTSIAGGIVAGSESGAHSPSKSAKISTLLNKLAIQPSGKTVQRHDGKYTFLVAKPQDNHLAYDDKLDGVNDKVNKLHQSVYVSDANSKEWAKYPKRLATQMRAGQDEILTEAGSTV